MKLCSFTGFEGGSPLGLWGKERGPAVRVWTKEREVPGEREDRAESRCQPRNVLAVMSVPLLFLPDPQRAFSSSPTLICFSYASSYCTHVCYYANKGFLSIGVSLQIHSGIYLASWGIRRVEWGNRKCTLLIYKIQWINVEFSTSNIDMLLWREAVCREINFMGGDRDFIIAQINTGSHQGSEPAKGAILDWE